MKNILAFILGCMCISPLAAQIETTSTIQHVTVFMEGAELNHTTLVQLPEGKTTVVLTGLAPDMDPASVMLEVSPKEVVILSVSSRTNYLKPAPESARITPVRDSLDMLVNELDVLRDEIAVLTKEKELLFKDESIGGTSKGIAVGEIEKAAEFYRKRTNEINAKLRMLRQKQTLSERMRVAYQYQLTELNAKFNPPTSEVMVLLKNPGKQQVEIKTRYIVSHAGWAPKYDIRSEEVGKDINLVYRAHVFNDCGVDWNGVKLSLSTSNPQRGADKPNIDRWDLADKNKAQNAYQLTSANMAQQTRGAVRDEVQVMSEISSIEMKSMPKRRPEAEVVKAMVQIQELSTRFEIKEPYSIPSDAKPYLVDVAEHTLPTTYEYYLAPAFEGAGYLTSRLTGWNGLGLVTGYGYIYLNGAYLGKSLINTAIIEDTLTVSFGADNRIVSQRKELQDFSKKQVLGNNIKETRYYETTVRNNRTETVTIVVEDQIPVTSQGSVSIETLELTEGVLDKVTGKVSWKFTLKPGESKKLTLGYSIKAPKNWQYEPKRFRTISCPSF